MNKFALYIFLMLVYLGLSKSFVGKSDNNLFIKDEYSLKAIFDGGPISVVLVDFFEAGLIVKSRYHIYKIVYGFNKRPNFVMTNVGREFYQKNINHLGMSLFRRNSTEEFESVAVTIPGALYIGDLAYGSWIYKNSGEKVWKFHKAYARLPLLLGWNTFRPNYSFYQQLKIHLGNNKIYFGDKNQFGKEGTVTESFYKAAAYRNKLKKRLGWKRFKNDIFSLKSNWMNNNERTL